jgi:hypothetical protein
MLAAFHRALPLAGLTVGLVAVIGWLGVMGYLLIKLF